MVFESLPKGLELTSMREQGELSQGSFARVVGGGKGTIVRASRILFLKESVF